MNENADISVYQRMSVFWAERSGGEGLKFNLFINLHNLGLGFGEILSVFSKMNQRIRLLNQRMSAYVSVFDY